MADQHPFGYEERFKFTGKERDSETNYDYFGARFYASLFGFWLSVDPLSDKYPNISPYAYCAWNPIKYVDPDGKDITLAGTNKSSVSIKTDLINLNVNISNLNVDFRGNYTLQGDEILSAALDLAGIFDPSGVADGLNVMLQWNNGDIGDAVISAAGLFPYLGDLAKVGKVEKDIKIIKDATRTVKNGAKKVNKSSPGKSVLNKKEAEHTKNARPSTKNKHQEGQARKSQDKQGEKGDARRKRYK